MGKCQPRVIIYIKFVDLGSPMLHVKLKIIGPLALEKKIIKVFTRYGRGGNSGHVSWAIYMNFSSLLPWRFYMNFVFDWPSGLREDA